MCASVGDWVCKFSTAFSTDVLFCVYAGRLGSSSQHRGHDFKIHVCRYFIQTHTHTAHTRIYTNIEAVYVRHTKCFFLLLDFLIHSMNVCVCVFVRVYIIEVSGWRFWWTAFDVARRGDCLHLVSMLPEKEREIERARMLEKKRRTEEEKNYRRNSNIR